MKGRQWIIMAAALGAALVLAGCSKDPAPSAQTQQASQGAVQGGAQGAQSTARAGGGQGGSRFATIQVQAITVQSGPLITDNDTAGTIVPVTQSQVAAQIAGVVSRIVHNVGDWVSAGTAVVQLDDSQLQLAVQSAQAGLDNARINLAMGQQTTSESNPKLVEQLQSAQTAMAAAQKNYNSQKSLFDLGGISASALDNAQSQLQQARANVQNAQLALDQNNSAGTQSLAQLQLAVDQANVQLALAQLNLRNASIKAPFAGQIAAVNVSPGVFVSQNTSVFLLVSQVRQINFSEPPTDATNFRLGDMIRFTYQGKTYPVKITQEPSSPINGVVPMVAGVPVSLAAPYGSVGTITYSLTLASGPQLPISALQTRANTNFVYLIVNGKATEQPVTILAEAGDTAVVAGVNAGAEVIISAPPGLVAGSTVQAVQVTASGAGSGGSAQQSGAANAISGSGGQGARTGQAATGGQGAQAGKTTTGSQGAKPTQATTQGARSGQAAAGGQQGGTP